MSTLKQLTDQTTYIKNDIRNCHSNLVQNLRYIDVQCNNYDKFNVLVDKVRNVTTGKRWASGKFYNVYCPNNKYFYFTGTSYGTSHTYAEFTFPFNPTTVIINYGTSAGQIHFHYISNIAQKDYAPFCAHFSDNGRGGGTYKTTRFQVDENISVSNNTFHIPVMFNSGYTLSTVNWIIFD